MHEKKNLSFFNAHTWKWIKFLACYAFFLISGKVTLTSWNILEEYFFFLSHFKATAETNVGQTKIKHHLRLELNFSFVSLSLCFTSSCMRSPSRAEHTLWTPGSAGPRQGKKRSKYRFHLLFAGSSPVILKPSVSGYIPHLPVHSTVKSYWPLPPENFLGLEKKMRERAAEGERGREGGGRGEGEEAEAHETLPLAGEKKEKWYGLRFFFYFFLFWDEAKIPEFHLIHKWLQLWPTEAAESGGVSGSFGGELRKRTVDFPAEQNLLIKEGAVRWITAGLKSETETAEKEAEGHCEDHKGVLIQLGS